MKMVLNIIYTMLVLFFVSLCGFCLWYYFSFIVPFSKIPSVRMEISLLKWFLTKKKITTYGFEKIVSKGKQHLSEGLCVIWLFKPMIMIFNEEDIKNVTSNNLDKAAEYRIFHEVFGAGLFTGDKHLWKDRRKLFNPIFRMGMLKDNIDTFNKYSRKLVEDINEMDLTASVVVEKHLKYFSFNVISEAILDLDPETSFYPDEKEMIIQFVDAFSEFLVLRITKPWLYFMKLFPEGREFLRRLKQMNEFTKKKVFKVKESDSARITNETRNDDSQCRTSRKSFVDVLMGYHVRDPVFTLENMISEVNLFVAAGYDTVSYGLSWCLFLLGQHPEVQDLIYDEITSLEQDVSFDDLQQLTHLESVIKETLRLFPPIPIIARRLENDTQCGKYKIPKGTTVAICSYVYHRNPTVFPNPDKFDPSRFLSGNAERSHIAFSSGIRNCIGNKFAMMEMKIALVHILRKFTIFSKDDYRTTKTSWEILLRPDKPIRLKFTPRN